MLLTISKRAVLSIANRQAFASGSVNTDHKKSEDDKPTPKFPQWNEYLSKPPVKPDPFALYNIMNTKPYAP